MKARITHMKAPWPLGALVGDVVEFAAGSVPVWAVGKCVEVSEDDEQVVAHLISPASTQPAEDGRADPVARVVAEAQAHIDQLKADHSAQVAELQGQIQAQAADLEAARADKDSALALVAELQGKLDAAASASKKK